MAKDKPGKYDIKPYDPEKMKFEMVTADDTGTPQYLPPQHEAMVKNLINSMAPEQTPVGGLIFVPEKKYKQIQGDVNRGYLFGKKISTGNEENFQMGGDALGDGFSLPQYRRTYLNAALLKDPKKLEYVLAHELGHNAAWLSDPKHPDLSERGADEFKDAYLKRAKDTRKNWDEIEHLPTRRTLAAIGDEVVEFHPEMSPDEMNTAAKKVYETQRAAAAPSQPASTPEEPAPADTSAALKVLSGTDKE